MRSARPPARHFAKPMEPRTHLARKWHEAQVRCHETWLARPAGFEPATRCLEGSCSVRLSYGRSEISLQAEDHMTATRRSQCVGLRTQIHPASVNSSPYPNPPSAKPIPTPLDPLSCASAPATFGRNEQRQSSARAGTRAQRPGEPPAGEERPGGCGGAGSPRVGVPCRGRIGRTARPEMPHPVHGPQLRDHAARTIRIRRHRVPVPARDDGVPAPRRRTAPRPRA